MKGESERKRGRRRRRSTKLASTVGRREKRERERGDLFVNSGHAFCN